MTKSYASLALSAIIALGTVSCSSPKENESKQSGDFDPFVEELVQKMTLEQKAGQMTQINVDEIMEGAYFDLVEPNVINEDKLARTIEQYQVGSMLNCGGHAYTVDEWHTIINSIQAAAQKTDLQIPVLYGVDAIHGANYTMASTLFPQQLAQAASFNPELVKRGAEITAYETRASGIPWNFSPVLDLGRQPVWGRFFETYGEDVYLAKQMTTAAIHGYEQGDISQPTAVASCMKHFLGYSFPFTGRDRTTVYLDEVQLREYYLPTFERAIAAGAHTIMINSGELNGTPVHANKDILTDLLRDELGFTGLAVTDWEDISKLVDFHRVAADNKEAIELAINAGIDMSMVPHGFEFTEDLVALVKEGRISEERIDLSVKRILQLKLDLGLFDKSDAPSKEDYPLFGSDEHYAEALKMAEESITLLKNEDVLPFDKDTKVLLIGDGAHSMKYMNGAWSRSWLGKDTLIDESVRPTLYEAFQNQGFSVTWLDSDVSNIELKMAAISHDVAVVCITEEPATEKPADISTLMLDDAQLSLAERVSDLRIPSVAVLFENRPQIITPVVDDLDAIFLAYWPGDAGGDALVNLMSGEANPSGKLPFTYPRHTNALITYDHKGTDELDTDFSMNAFDPLYTFGHGLSYTTFEYGEMELSSSSLNANGTLTASVTVTNTGNAKGKETLMLFYRDHFASITPSVKKLVRFEKIELAPGESKTVEFEVDATDFSFINKKLQRVTEDGTFSLMIKDQVKEFNYSSSTNK